jgi:hypothetical protein
MLKEQNKSQLYDPGALAEDRLPKMISDALYLMDPSGEPYLWMDALCIQEDSAEDQIAQISMMDIIYSQASFTIIATSGKDANSRFPGLHDGSRVPQELAEIALPPSKTVAEENNGGDDIGAPEYPIRSLPRTEPVVQTRLDHAGIGSIESRPDFHRRPQKANILISLALLLSNAIGIMPTPIYQPKNHVARFMATTPMSSCDTLKGASNMTATSSTVILGLPMPSLNFEENNFSITCRKRYSKYLSHGSAT